MRSRTDRLQWAFTAFVRQPVDFCSMLASRLRNVRRRPVKPYLCDPHWEADLHTQLGQSQPCAAVQAFCPLWEQVLAEMTSRGVKTGPMSYSGWNDGDPGLTRAIWCLIHHLAASRVVETGVAHGVTSRFVLEALQRNDGGRLWSIDMPPLLLPELHQEIGVAVPDALRTDWTLIRGSSRRRLPALLDTTRPIDLFIHDSLHTTENVLFELRRVWPHVRAGGAVVVDDVDINDGFRIFVAETAHARSWVCEAEPIRPDDRRSNNKGMFGIILKQAI
jgi:hypothetical protein